MEIKLNELSFAYEQVDVLKNIDLFLKSGDVTLLLGPNGAGKTTLIKCLLGELKTSRGKITYDKIEINDYTEWQKIGYIPQDLAILGFPITVREFLNAFSNRNLNRVTTILRDVGIEYLAHRNISSLSGGERKRVYLARALLNEVELLILDEPLAAVDDENIKLIKDLLKRIASKKISIIIVTHNYNALAEIANNVIVLEKTVVFSGSKTNYHDYLKVV